MIQIPSSSYLLAWPMATTQSRRDLLLAAMIRVVGAKGYRDPSVADVIEEAGASRTTFYKHFEDKHDCFLAAYDDLVERVFRAGAGKRERVKHRRHTKRIRGAQ